jgi:hypothetical protein
LEIDIGNTAGTTGTYYYFRAGARFLSKKVPSLEPTHSLISVLTRTQSSEMSIFNLYPLAAAAWTVYLVHHVNNNGAVLIVENLTLEKIWPSSLFEWHVTLVQTAIGFLIPVGMGPDACDWDVTSWGLPSSVVLVHVVGCCRSLDSKAASMGPGACVVSRDFQRVGRRCCIGWWRSHVASQG